MNRITMSFGPAALRDGDSLLQVADVLYQYQQSGQRMIAVVSALEGVTDLLAESITLGNYSRVYNKLLSIHQSIARKLIRDERDRALLIQDITDILESYNWLGRTMVNRTPTPTESATILGIGERLSARLLTGHFQNRGVRATVLNGSELIITGDDAPTARPDLVATQGRVSARLLPRLDDGYLVVVGGGIGGTPEGKTTRLPDTANLSSAVLAVAAQADGLWLWTDRDGIMTADPKLVTNARTLTALSAQTLAPVLEAAIPVFIRNIYNPGQSGTYVQANGRSSTMRALIVKDRLRMLHLRGQSLDPLRGIAALTRQRTAALVAVENADELYFFVSAAESNSSRLTLEDVYRVNQAVCSIADGQVGLVTVVGADADPAAFTSQLESALSSADIPLLRVVRTLGARPTERYGLAAVVATEDLKPAVNVIHDLILSQNP